MNATEIAAAIGALAALITAIGVLVVSRQGGDSAGSVATTRRSASRRAGVARPVLVTLGIVGVIVLIVVVGGQFVPGAGPDATPAGTPAPTSTPSLPPEVRPPTTAPPPSAGSIPLPGPDAQVRSCAYFHGVATVRAGRTLILVKSNRTTGDPRRFVEYVFGWDSPSSPTWSWQGAQYFGARAGDAVNQVFRVELMSVDLDAVRVAARWADSGA